MILAIVGSREFKDYTLFLLILDKFIDTYGTPDKVVSGGARGADKFAEMWAEDNKVPIEVFKPNWNIGKHAGLLRNTDIINACTHVLAFPSKNGTGTQDSIRKAKEQGKILTIHYID